MGFLDLFRPKWKHSDADVRAEAVRHLDENDTAVLNQIVQHDRDVRVRRIALKKIEDPAVLGEIAQRDADEGLRRTAAEKAAELLLGTALGEGDEKECLDAVERIARMGGAGRALSEVARRAGHERVRAEALMRIQGEEQKLLAEVAKGAEDPGVRQQAAGRLTDPEALRDLAVNGPDRELALRAVARIEDTALLDDIVRRGKNKAVRAAAKERLGPRVKQAAPAEATPEMLRRARQQQLCRTVEAAAKNSDWEAARKEIHEAREAWAALGRADEELQRRFDRACKQFQDRLDEMQRVLEQRSQERAERLRREAEENQQVQERLSLCEQIEQLAVTDPKELAARVEEARVAWEKLPPAPGARKGELEKRFRRACEDALRRGQRAAAQKQARARLFAVCVEAEGIPLTGPGGLRAAEQRFRDLEKEWRTFEAALRRRRPGAAPGDAPGDAEAPPADPETEEIRQRFYKVRDHIVSLREAERARRAGEEAAQLTRLEEACQKLEGLGESQDLKRAEKVLRDAQALFRGAGALPRDKREALHKRFQAAREKLVVHLQELRSAEEWKRWANVPQLEQLCQKAEALLQVPEDTDPRRLARELKELQKGWKAVGPAPKEKSEALWQRFKETSEKIHQRFKEHFEKLDVAREESLKTKEELCQKAEALADAPDEGINWKETAEQLKKLQEEWKAAGPAKKEQKEQSDALWKRFRGACDRFFGRRKEHAGKNEEERAQHLAQKEELCRKAEALVGSSDWKKATDLLKGYQAEWKKTGAGPREQGEALWKRFREACDQFFARRKEHFAEADREREQNLLAKEAMCAKVEGIAAEDIEDDQAAVELVRTYMAEWKTIGPAPREKADAVWERFRTACNQLVERARRPLTLPVAEEAGKPASRFENKLPLEKLAELLAGHPDPE